MDTMTDTDGAVSTVPAAAATVNGPEDEDLDWASVDWRRAEEDVRRLRQRIFHGIAGRGPSPDREPLGLA